MGVDLIYRTILLIHLNAGKVIVIPVHLALEEGVQLDDASV
jgi:hypothetical protein